MSQKYSWVNNSLFENALRQRDDDDSIFVKTFEVSQEVSKRNQNYWCDTVKVLINYTNSSNVAKTQNVVLKIAFYTPYMVESLEKFNPFKRELFFHQNLMPKIEGLMLLSGADNARLTKKAISIVNMRPQPKYIMFEELPSNVFSKVDRKRGLDVHHMRVALEKVATLHAASAVLYAQDVELFSNHQHPNISEYFKIFHPLFVNCVKSLVDEISNDDFDGAAVLASKLNAFERNMIDKASEAFMLQNDEFGVLCHGDLWLNNLLFSYGERALPSDVRIVDFGLSYFGSPAIDLSYLLFTSSSDDIKDYEIDILLQFYHQKLHASLIKFNYSLPIPSLIQIHNDFLKRGVIGFLYSCLLLPMRFSDASTVKDLSAFVHTSDDALKQRKEFFADPCMKQRFQFLLNFFDRKGFLD